MVGRCSIMRIIFLLIVFLQFDSIAQEDSCVVYIPNVFMDWDCDYQTKDGFFVTSNCALKEYHLKLFNHWGEVVFESFNQEENWIPSEESPDTEEGFFICQLSFLDDQGSNKMSPKQREITSEVFYLKR